MKARRLYILLPAIAVLLRCTHVDLAGPSGEGNGSETIARGIIVDSMGIAAAGVQVQLLPAAYDPVIHGALSGQWSTLTDTKGEYRFDCITAGTYALEAGSTSAGLKALIKGIQIPGTNNEVVIDTGKLRRTGTVIIHLKAMAPHGGDYVYLPGTSTFSIITAGDSAAEKTVLNGVPAATFTDLMYVAAADFRHADLLKDTLTVHPGDTVVSAYAAWKHTRKLLLNTTVSGADIQGNVYDFPILVRLTKATFDFSQAKSGGADIRFTKSDNSFLPYEIERWDAANKLAEIWVKVDTVYGSDSMQTLCMYWGNAYAADSSNGSAVFDTTENAAAVWHLNQSCNDATYNNHDGIESSAADTAGIIGLCKKFNGSDSIKIAGLLGTPSSFSLSAWAQLDSTTPGGGSEILSIGDAALIRMDYAMGGIGTLGAIHLPGDSVFLNMTSGQFLKRTGWHFITFIMDQNSSNPALYIDGTKVASRTNLTTPPNYTGVGQNTYIGKHGNGKTGFNFIGKIDEVRVYRTVVSADFIKLSFMNQKKDDLLVRFYR